jgi:hypothetical protein
MICSLLVHLVCVHSTIPLKLICEDGIRELKTALLLVVCLVPHVRRTYPPVIRCSIFFHGLGLQYETEESELTSNSAPHSSSVLAPDLFRASSTADQLRDGNSMLACFELEYDSEYGR